MGSQISKEPVGCDGQLLDAASQAVGRHGVLHQAPDALDRVGVVGCVLGQSEHADAWIGLCWPFSPSVR